MNRIQKAFDEKKKVFIGFVTAGDPNLAVTKELVRAMIKGGAGLIEFGIPFSDPVAEGEVIQKADMRALAAGTTTDKIFDLVAELREETPVPLVFLTYANPIYAYGAEKFFTRCEESGVDGVIIPDIPYEEREEMRPFSEPHHVALVPLIAPTSKDRIQKIAAIAQGYVYVVSSLGVTGVRSNITTDIDGIVAEVRKATDIPVAVGFGIAAPEQAYKMAKASDGAIVGSAIEKIVAQYGVDSPAHVYEYVKSMSEAVAQAAAEDKLLQRHGLNATVYCVRLFKNEGRGRIVEFAVLEVDNFGGEAFQQCIGSTLFEINQVVLVDISVFYDYQQISRYFRCILRNLAAVERDVRNNFQITDRLLVFIVQHSMINIFVQGTSES